MQERIHYIKSEDYCQINMEYKAILEKLNEVYGYPPEIVVLDGEAASPADIAYSLEAGGLFASLRLVWWKNPLLLRSGGRKKVADEAEYLEMLDVLGQPGESILVVSNYIEEEKKSARRPAKKKAAPGKEPGPKRGKGLEAWLENNAVVHNLLPLSPGEMEKWIVQEMKFRQLTANPEEIGRLARSGQDMYYLLTLLDKLSILVPGGIIGKELLDEELEIKQESSIFRMLDSMSEQKPVPALHMLNGLLEQGQVPLVILSMMARELKIMSKVKALQEAKRSADDIQIALKQAPFIVKKHIKNARNFSWQDIDQLFARMLETDVAFKSTAKNERLLLENIIMAYGRRK